MTPRLDPFNAAPREMKAMLALEAAVRDSGLPMPLVELVKIRASQINGCAYCLHMHTQDARAAGETEERIYLLSAWRESPLFTAVERAALGWTEALTRVADTGAPDADFEALRPHFSDTDIAKLTLLIGVINVWNRLAIGLRSVHPVGNASAPR